MKTFHSIFQLIVHGTLTQVKIITILINPSGQIDNAGVISYSNALNINGCTDSLASNFNPNANVDDGSCIFAGCTNPTSINFDPTATIDDGSCITQISGCVDIAALKL